MSGTNGTQGNNITANLNSCAEADTGYYNLNLHVASVFILLLASAFGVFLPIITKRYFSHAIKADNALLLFGKFFGGGVMVSTAFVHILPDAIQSLTTDCLPWFFTDGYTAFGYFLTMVSALALHLVEWIAIRVNLPDNFKRQATTSTTRNSSSEEVNDEDGEQKEDHGHAHGHGHAHAHRGHDVMDIHAKLKATVSTIMLELAIAVHSVIIGIALGLATGEFATLFIALSFHQFFEGVGIGFRIAGAEAYSNLAAILTGAFFSVTTPIGVAVGIGISVVTSEPTVGSIVTQGAFEAIAAGLLLYSALVSITAEEFATTEFHRLRIRRRVLAFIAFYLGVAAMALLGFWA